MEYINDDGVDIGLLEKDYKLCGIFCRFCDYTQHDRKEYQQVDAKIVAPGESVNFYGDDVYPGMIYGIYKDPIEGNIPFQVSAYYYLEPEMELVSDYDQLWLYVDGVWHSALHGSNAYEPMIVPFWHMPEFKLEGYETVPLEERYHPNTVDEELYELKETAELPFSLIWQTSIRKDI